MKTIHLFIETKNNHLTDASAKAINYFQKVREQFVDHICHVYHFVSSSTQHIKQVEISNSQNYTIISYSEQNLLGESSELDQLLENLTHSADSKYLFAKSVKLENVAALISTKFSIPLINNVVKIENGQFLKEIFSGKAKASFSCESSSWIAIFSKSLSASSEIVFKEMETGRISLSNKSSYQIVNINRISNTIPLPDAQIVVGAGRGLKDPSNWAMIENLANKLGAATACSKPVSDLNWRPHHEHVGQTGIKISPKLYIACGISGAIQHLAGVNNSGKIVVINNDPEAPFFKNADYGIVGDVFDIVPRLLKKLN